MDSEQGIQLDDLKHILGRRSRLVLAVLAAGLLLATFIAAILPNQYESRATLLIEPQTIAKNLVEPNLAETELNKRLHLISMQILSRGRLSKVIDEFDVYPELEGEMTREEIIEKMRSEIAVAPVLSDLEARVGVRAADMEINTFQLTYRHRNRDIAAAVANRLANDFVEEHIKERAEMSGDTSEFIEAELQRLSARIAELEQKISTVKSLNIGRLPEDLPSNQNQHERLVQNIRDTQRELAIAQSDEAFYRQQVLVGGAEFLKWQNDDTPEKRLEQMRLALNEAQSRGLTEKHPDIIKYRQEIASLESTIKDSRAEDKPLSMAQENAKAEMQRAGLRANSAKAELDRLQAQLRDLESRLAETPKVAEQLSAYEREYQHLFDSYQQYSSKRLEAGVAADMERRQKGEKFRVLEAAIPTPDAGLPQPTRDPRDRRRARPAGRRGPRPAGRDHRPLVPRRALAAEPPRHPGSRRGAAGGAGVRSPAHPRAARAAGARRRGGDVGGAGRVTGRQLDRERAARSARPPGRRRIPAGIDRPSSRRHAPPGRWAVARGSACTTSTTGSFAAPSR